MKTSPFLRAKQSNREFFITTMPAHWVVALSYASVRGQDMEEGAIQRVLNTSRIASIKDFTLRGGGLSKRHRLELDKQRQPSFCCWWQPSV